MRNVPMKRRRGEHGSVMLIALTVLLMGSLVAISALNTSDTDVGIAGNYNAKLQSFYVAEAGVEMAYGVLRDTVTWRTGFDSLPFGGGMFNVTLVDSSSQAGLDDTVIVFSTGLRSEAVTQLEVWFASAHPFQWAAFGDDYLKVCGDSRTDSFDSDSGSYAATHRDTLGNVGSNGHIDLCGSADVNGDAMTSSPGDMEITGSADVSGDTTTTAPEIYLDPITTAELNYALANSNAPAGLSGGFTYNALSRDLRVGPMQTMTMTSGIYYFNDIEIYGTVDLAPGAEVQIYIADFTKFGALAKVNLNGRPADVQIFSAGSDMLLTAGAEIWAVVYAPETNIQLTGGCDLYGSFLGNVADDIGGSSFHYDRALGSLRRSTMLEKIAWREL